MLDMPHQDSVRGRARWLLDGLWAPKGHATGVLPIVLSLAIVGVVTVFLAAVGPLVELDHAAFGYLIPVIIAAARWGAVPALVSAAAGMAASAFFFYPPLYDIRVYHPAHVADLLL